MRGCLQPQGCRHEKCPAVPVLFPMRPRRLEPGHVARADGAWHVYVFADLHEPAADESRAASRLGGERGDRVADQFRAEYQADDCRHRDVLADHPVVQPAEDPGRAGTHEKVDRDGGADA